MTDFRALCADLLDELKNAIRVIHCEDGTRHISSADPVIAKVDAALAQPEPEGPTDEELLRVAASAIDPYQSCGIALNEYEAETETALEVYGSELIAFARAVLARWGRPTPQPIPVSERLPGPGDCDAEGRCWWWRSSHPESGYSEGWMLRPWAWGSGRYDFDDRLMHTHWLPAHALPPPAEVVE